MLIWANKNEVNIEMINAIEELHNSGGFEPQDKLREELKAWELSVIFRQIQIHFGSRKDISILDFGVGASPFGAYLNHRGYQSITCMDKENGMRPEINQENYNLKYDAHVRYIKTDFASNYDGRHDVIFSASVLEHIRSGKRLEIMQAISRCLNPGGLIIHVADYDRGIDFKKLIDNCSIPISYSPEETPGCKEFNIPPEYAWLKEGKSRIAFFNDYI